MKTSDFYFDLPKELIAQTPMADRSSSRLLLLDRQTGQVGHGVFTDIKKYLKAGDCLVINDTKVIPARLMGRKQTGAVVEIMLLKRLDLNRWEALVRPGKRLKIGTEVLFGEENSGKCKLKAIIVKELADGLREVEFHYHGVFEEILDDLGEMPLPPYITKKLGDKSRYNTVYALHEGSSAAPTAGLHFTQTLLKEIEELGVNIARVTLHVGLGTFRPVKAENIEEHHMHSEYYEISPDAASLINNAMEQGNRVIAVGTTAVRTLESAAVKTEQGYRVPSTSGNTSIFIYPGYAFKVVDGIITNFHLPESTLIMLVSAFGGRKHVLEAYEEAVREKYRFFSFGDAMLILNDLFK